MKTYLSVSSHFFLQNLILVKNFKCFNDFTILYFPFLVAPPLKRWTTYLLTMVSVPVFAYLDGCLQTVTKFPISKIASDFKKV